MVLLYPQGVGQLLTVTECYLQALSAAAARLLLVLYNILSGINDNILSGIAIIAVISVYVTNDDLC